MEVQETFRKEASGFKTLEKKYGIEVLVESKYNPMNGKWFDAFYVYSADDALWDKCCSRKAVKKMCEEDGEALKQIKATCEAAQRKAEKAKSYLVQKLLKKNWKLVEDYGRVDHDNMKTITEGYEDKGMYYAKNGSEYIFMVEEIA